MKINEESKQVLIFILIMIFMFILIVITIALVNNISLIKKNPMRLGMDNYGFSYCNCYDNESTMWIINDKGIRTESINFNLLPK
jgi:hypothetical protein